MPPPTLQQPDGRQPPADAELIGRGPELAMVDALAARAREGDGDALVITGEMGIGKTSVLKAARRRFEDAGLRVLHARGTELEQAYGFGAARQLLDAPLREHGEDDAVWAGSAALARPIFDDLTAGGEPDVDTASFARRQGLYWLLVQLTDRIGPLALVVDDAQWVDELTLQFLLHLSLRIDGLPIVLVVMSRPVSTVPADSALQELAAGVPHRALGPLWPEDVGEYVEQHWGPPTERFGQSVHELTGGVPLLVRELVEELQRRADGPPPPELPADLRQIGVRTIAARVQRELRRAGPGALALAQATAILGDDVPLDLALLMAAIPASEAAAALQPLVLAGIVHEQSGRLTFAHAVVHASVMTSIPAPDRGAMHRRAAEHLQRTHPGDRRIAGHLLESPPAGDGWAQQILRDAAGRATALGDPVEAARLLERALAEVPEPTVALRWELARALAYAGRPENTDHYLLALAQAEPGPERLGVVQDYAGALMMAAKTDAAFAVLDDELSQLPGPMPEEAVGGMHALALFARSDRARAFREEHIAVHADPPGAEHAAVLAYEAMIRNQPADSIGDLLDLAFGGKGFPAALANSPAYGYGVLALICTDRLDEALAEVRRQAIAARAMGAFMLEGLVDTLRAFALWRSGRLVEAEGAAIASLTHADDVAWRFGRVSASVFLSNVLPDQGRVEEARAAIDRVPAADLATDSNLIDLFDHARATVLIAEGKPELAVEVVLAAGERLVKWGAVSPTICPWRSTAAQALAMLGDHDRALALAREELELAEASQVRSAIATAALAVGTVGGEPDVAAIRRALETAHAVGSPVLEAKARVALGRTQRIAGERTEARETLKQAIVLAERSGAKAVADQALDEMSAAGGRPRVRDAVGAGSLTSSELRVARLAALGATNREIAQQLYLSQKTVEMHLRNVYRKLDVPGRAHLPAQLGDGEGGDDRDGEGASLA